MAVKKDDTAVEMVTMEITGAVGKTQDFASACEKAPAKADAEKVRASEAPTKQKTDDADFCVYLGPNIHGVIQSGTVYGGNRKTAETALATAIAKYPLIAKLIVTDKTIAEDRIKVKTAGNALNVFYKQLASGKST